MDRALRHRLGPYVAKMTAANAGWSLPAAKWIAAVGIVSAAGYGAAKLWTTRPAVPPAALTPVSLEPASGAVVAPLTRPSAEPPPALPPPVSEPKSKSSRQAANTTSPAAGAKLRESIDGTGTDAVAAPENVSPPMSEVEYLERARSLVAQDPAEALRLADRRAEKFPRGTLAPEAEMVAVLALERLDRKDAARARAEAALARYPGSIYADSWRRRAQSTR